MGLARVSHCKIYKAFFFISAKTSDAYHPNQTYHRTLIFDTNKVLAVKVKSAKTGFQHICIARYIPHLVKLQKLYCAKKLPKFDIKEVNGYLLMVCFIYAM